MSKQMVGLVCISVSASSVLELDVSNNDLSVGGPQLAKGLLLNPKLDVIQLEGCNLSAVRRQENRFSLSQLFSHS